MRNKLIQTRDGTLYSEDELSLLDRGRELVFLSLPDEGLNTEYVAEAVEALVEEHGALRAVKLIEELLNNKRD